MLVDALAGFQRGGPRAFRGVHRRHHLDQLHDLRGVEEVQADHVSRARRGRGELDHREAARRRGEDRPRREDLVQIQLNEQLIVELYSK